MFDLSDRITWIGLICVFCGALYMCQTGQRKSDALSLIMAADRRGDCAQVQKLRDHFDYRYDLGVVSNTYNPNCK